MIGFDTVVREFKVGTTFYEDVYGTRFEYLVTTNPKVIDDQVTWDAINYDGGAQKFLITKGLEHYGPKLYWEGDY